MKKNKIKSGFTMIELLVVITIIAVLTLALAILDHSSLSREHVISGANETANLLKLAQTRALTGYMDDDWGVKLDQDEVVVFKGADYENRDTSYDEIKPLPEPSEIGEMVLNGAADYIIFNKHTGLTGNYGSFAITEKDLSQTIIINPKGVIENHAL